LEQEQQEKSLKKLGFSYEVSKKDIYIDGHERQDVDDYRNDIFLELWEKYSKRFLIFNEDGTWNLPLNISPGH
jgi:hypothetical protein